MRAIQYLALCALTLLAACGRPQPGDAQPAATAELVFTNGRVFTVDANRSWARAVAVAGGRIIYVGNDRGALALADARTRVVDLGGRMLMPSFQDSHVHPIRAGMQALAVDLAGSEDLGEYIATIRKFADAHPDEPWILGGGWSMAVFGPGGKARKELLDEIVPDRPVYLHSRDGHSAWANSKALEMAGIDEDTQDPASGIVDRDPRSGKIIGSLQEGAMDLLEVHIPPPTQENRIAGMSHAARILNGYGITAIQDAWVLDDDLETYREMDRRGILPLRVTASQWWDRERGLEQIEHFKENREAYGSGRLKAGTVKIMQDGILENFTAAMLEPYLVEGDPTGIPMVEPELLKEAVRVLDSEGFQVHFHAIGTAAIRQCLDAVEVARSANGDTGNRHHISHLEVVHPDDIPRFRELDVIANFQPLWAYADEYVMELNLPFVGEERLGWFYPIRGIINAGGMVAFGSDWFVSTANPFPQIETAVTRIDAYGDGEPFIPGETIDLQSALAAFTINAAFVNGIEDSTGSIEIGKAADLIVLDRNLFAIDPKEISDAKVLLTLLDGVPVHGDLAAL